MLRHGLCQGTVRCFSFSIIRFLTTLYTSIVTISEWIFGKAESRFSQLCRVAMRARTGYRRTLPRSERRFRSRDFRLLGASPPDRSGGFRPRSGGIRRLAQAWDQHGPRRYVGRLLSRPPDMENRDSTREKQPTRNRRSLTSQAEAPLPPPDGNTGQEARTADIWVKCPGCKEIAFRKEIERNLNVCSKCGYHLRLTVEQRLAMSTAAAGVNFSPTWRSGTPSNSSTHVLTGSGWKQPGGPTDATMQS